MPSVPPNITDDETFWSRVDKSADCWLWVGRKNPGGYGRYGKHYAHRLAYQAARGPVPSGMHLDHICHTVACLNPDHLEVVTCSQNGQNRAGVPINNTSGVRGVSWHKATGAWRTYATVNRTQYTGGYFHDLAEAEQAVIALRNRVMTNNRLDRTAA